MMWVSLSRICDKMFRIKNKIASNELIKVAPFRSEVRRTAPHKHNQYFEIVYLSAGSGDHWIDGRRYPVNPPVLFFINAGQVHHWDLTGRPEGHVLIFKYAFIGHADDGQLKQLLQRLWTVHCTYLHTASKGDIEVLFELLERQASSPDDLSKIMTEGLLKALISKMLILVHPSLSHADKGLYLYARYLDLLNRQNKIQRKVSYYAGQLSTTPQNLNAACRKAAGQTAGELITGHILGEAKRLLLYTEDTVSQIAYQLEFTDPSYFVKYFKKHLNITPEAFRKQSFSK